LTAQETLYIKWKTLNIVDNVNISISYKGGKNGTYDIIASETPNDGMYEWIVSEGISSNNCVIKVEPINQPDKGNTQGKGQ
jgi:hypothetical protein